MADAVLAVRLVSVALYAILGAVSLVRYRRVGGRPTLWFGITFAELAVVGLGLIFLPPEPAGGPAFWLLKLTFAGFLLFPYLLHRFTAAFKPASTRSEVVAGGLTGATIVAVIAMPQILGPTDPRPAWYSALSLVAILQWTTLTVAAAVRFWRAGRRKPTVIRRRLRTIALGSGGLGVMFVVAAANPARGSGSDLAVQTLALLCAVAFFTGFSPPRILRHIWRQPEEEAVRTAEAALMAATTEEQIAPAFLPQLSAVLGAEAAALYAPDGRLIGTHGAAESLPPFEAPSGSLREDLIGIDFPLGRLVVSADPYAPFFGREELSLARTLGSLASLALERCGGFRREREMRQQLAEAQEVARLGSWEWDVATGVVRWSDELHRIYGLEPGGMDTTEQGILDRIHPDDQEHVKGVILQACRDLQPFSFDHRIVTADGSVRHVHDRGKVITTPSGHVLRLVGTAQDVTERREGEANVRRLEAATARHRQAIELNDDIVQGLTVARYALDLGETHVASRAVDETLASARAIVSDLLREGESQATLGPGDLVRRMPVRLGPSGTPEAGAQPAVPDGVAADGVPAHDPSAGGGAR